MDANAVVKVSRAGKSFLSMTGVDPDSDPLRHSRPAATRYANINVGALDSVRSVFWQCYRHLFPPHALAVQMPNGTVVISWSVMDDPHARYPYAAPVVLRFDQDLLEAMERADSRQRVRIAENNEATLREGMRGYDPFARFPNSRVVTIG
jgi:trans-aconitate methyltransferase